jgi:hypothetical protein
MLASTPRPITNRVTTLSHRFLPRDCHARKPAGPVAGRTCQGAAEQRGHRGRPAGHDHQGRPDPGPLAEQGGRQGPVRQGAGNRAGRGPCRHRRAFAQGRADGAARGLRAGLRDGARGPARRLGVPPTPSLAALPQGAVVGTSSLRRVVLLRARCGLGDRHAHRAPARQPRHPPAQAGRGPYHAIVLAAAGLKRLGLAARIRTIFEHRPRCCRRPARARWASRSAPTAADLAQALAPLAAPAHLAGGGGRARGQPRHGRQLLDAAGRHATLARANTCTCNAAWGDPEGDARSLVQVRSADGGGRRRRWRRRPALGTDVAAACAQAARTERRARHAGARHPACARGAPWVRGCGERGSRPRPCR